jgi:hypothetical protein
MHWPEPAPELRARVLSGEPVEDRPVAWAARVATDSSARAKSRVPAVTTARAGHGWRRLGVAAVLSLVLMAGSCVALDVVEGHRVEAEVARFEARYGSLDVSTLVVPPVPADENQARILKAAAALTVPLPGLAYHHIEFHGPGPVPANLRAFAEANRDAIRLAGDVRFRQRSNWEIDPQRFLETMPYQPVRILSDALYLTALLDLEAGRADDATRMVVTGLAMAASLRQEPDSFVQQVRMIDLAKKHIEAVREIVSRSEPSRAALEELAAGLAENRTPDPMFVGTLTDIKGINAMFARMENGDIDPNTASWIYPMTWPSWPSRFLGPAARIGRPFVRQARVRYLQYMGELLDVLSSARPHPKLPEFPAPQRWALVDRLTDKFAGGSTWRANSINLVMSELSAAELAVALRRFRLDRGAYPDDLPALVPRYLATLPIDSYTGRPPVYARQGSGFTLRAQGVPGYEKVAWMALEWNVAK